MSVSSLPEPHLIRESLLRGVKEGKLAKDDLIAYSLLFQTIGNDPVLIRQAIANLSRQTGLFAEVENQYQMTESRSGEEQKISTLLQSIKQI